MAKVIELLPCSSLFKASQQFVVVVSYYLPSFTDEEIET